MGHFLRDVIYMKKGRENGSELKKCTRPSPFVTHGPLSCRVLLWFVGRARFLINIGERISFRNLNLQSLCNGRNEFYNSTHGVHIWKGFSRRRMSLFEKIVYDTASSAWREISSSWGWGVYWCLKLDCWLVFFFEVGPNVLFYLKIVATTF